MFYSLQENIEMLNDGDLVALCKDIYDWKHSGVLSSDSQVHELGRVTNKSLQEVETEVLDIAAHRLKRTVLLLLETKPQVFLTTHIDDEIDNLVSTLVDLSGDVLDV